MYLPVYIYIAATSQTKCPEYTITPSAANKTGDTVGTMHVFAIFWTYHLISFSMRIVYDVESLCLKG